MLVIYFIGFIFIYQLLSVFFVCSETTKPSIVAVNKNEEDKYYDENKFIDSFKKSDRKVVRMNKYMSKKERHKFHVLAAKHGLRHKSYGSNHRSLYIWKDDSKKYT